jgi:hypothetical protein
MTALHAGCWLAESEQILETQLENDGLTPRICSWIFADAMSSLVFFPLNECGTYERWRNSRWCDVRLLVVVYGDPRRIDHGFCENQRKLKGLQISLVSLREWPLIHHTSSPNSVHILFQVQQPFSTMKFAVFATLLATASAFSINKADIGKVRWFFLAVVKILFSLYEMDDV